MCMIKTIAMGTMYIAIVSIFGVMYTFEWNNTSFRSTLLCSSFLYCIHNEMDWNQFPETSLWNMFSFTIFCLSRVVTLEYKAQVCWILPPCCADGNVEVLSRASYMIAVGIVAGAYLGGLVNDRFRKQADMILFLSSLLGGLQCATIPWSRSIHLFGLVTFLEGVIQSISIVGRCKMHPVKQQCEATRM